MPNNRNRNRNRNRNKRNKNQNANQQASETNVLHDQQQPEQQQQEVAATTSLLALTATDDRHNDKHANSGSLSNGSTTTGDSPTIAAESEDGLVIRNVNESSETEQVEKPADSTENQTEKLLKKEQSEKELEDQKDEQLLIETVPATAKPIEELQVHVEEEVQVQSERQTEDRDLSKDQSTNEPAVRIVFTTIEEEKGCLTETGENSSVDQSENDPLRDCAAQVVKEVLDQVEDQLINQFEKQTKAELLSQTEVQKDNQLGNTTVNQQDQCLLSKDQSKKETNLQPVVRIVSVAIENKESSLAGSVQDSTDAPLRHAAAQVVKDVLDQVEDQLVNQFENQTEEKVLSQTEVQEVNQLRGGTVKQQDQSVQSEDQLETESKHQPVVHIVPVRVEKEENCSTQTDFEVDQPEINNLEESEAQIQDQSVERTKNRKVEKPTDHLETEPTAVHTEKQLKSPTAKKQDLSGESKTQLQNRPTIHIVPIQVERKTNSSTEQAVMGAKNSKQQSGQHQPQDELQQQPQAELPEQTVKPPGSPRQAKVIVHRVVREANDQTDAPQLQQGQQYDTQQLQEQQLPTPAATHTQQQQQQQQSQQHAPALPLQRSTKVIIHQIRVETDAEERARKGKPTIEEISSTTTTAATHHSNSIHNNGTLSPPPRYLVESPSPKHVSSGVSFVKVARDLQIQELEQNSDYSSGEFNFPALASPVVCEADSETEASTVTTTNSPMTIAVIPSLPDSPSSNRAEQQEQLRQKRAQKRVALESHFLPQLLSPRYLDSILEENSGETAVSAEQALCLSRSSSSGNDPAKTRPAVPAKANEMFPRSHLDFSRRHRRREDPGALMLETKLLDECSDVESCTRLQSTLSPQSEDAELVYLSSSASSSASDLMELELEQAAALAKRALIDLDTDASKLIHCPDDELSSTEPGSSCNETETECEVETEVDTETEATATQSSRESTPVNTHPSAQLSAGSSVSSLLSSAATPTPTPTPTATETPTLSKAAAAAGETLLANEFGPSKLANSSIAAASLSATREEFIRNMNKVRELIEMTRREQENAIAQNVSGHVNANVNGNENVIVNGNENENENRESSFAPEQQQMRCRLTPSPPPVPPPPSSMHYPVACTNTNTSNNTSDQPPLLAPLLLKRQESNDSHCSDSTQHSQCTAINLASPPPIPMPPTLFPAPPTPPLRQQKQHQHQHLQQQPNAELSAISHFSGAESDAERIKKLRLLCTETLASMPYGEQMLEELAHVAKDISKQQLEQQLQKNQQQHGSSMPYPLPNLPHISELQLSVGAQTAVQEDAWLGLPTQADPKLLVCLSPGQRALVEQQQQHQQPDQLLDAHEKFLQRRGYHELSAEQVRALDSEQLKLEQEQILRTASKMRELRKSLTPTTATSPTTPPTATAAASPTPPPVPAKSAETAAKAKSQAALADDVSQLRNSYQKVITSSTTTAATSTTKGTTSSVENKPQQTAATATAADQQPQPFEQLPYSFDQRTSSRTEQHGSNTASSSSSHYMSSNNSKFPAGMESELARMFPSMAKQGDIFDEQRKRFSNIEQSSQQQLPPQTKRYSNIETSSYESKKCTENGQVVYDYSNSSRQQQQEGEQPTNGKFPLRDQQKQQHQPQQQEQHKVHHISVRQAGDELDCAPPVPPPPQSAHTIMSATKLNGIPNTFIDDAQQQQQQLLTEQREHREQTTSTAVSSKVNSGGTYEEFRQRAKEALTAIAQPSDNNNNSSNSDNNTHTAQGNHLDNDKLFKDIDALSQQLNAELQTGRDQRAQRDKSASLYDLSRLSSSNSSQGQQQLEQLKRQRHAHMQELEREIERSTRSRQERMSSVPRLESTHEIPIELAPDYGQRSRRSESLCNLSESTRPHSSAEHYHRVLPHEGAQDDWSHYASDLGNSENIARPFAREVEICYQRQGQQRQPHAIRAPRLSASTNDLSSCSYDSYNAYGGVRRHAPMLQQAPPQQQRPHYASCYSMIERNPNPTYISTTSRRGVSPAPTSSTPTQPPAYDRQQRRASLPRELHEQQLKYILSKEEDLKHEFDRLQQERRRLMEEMQRAPTVLQAPPQRREIYRPAPKLPTLSEDEVFRQQMAEEWMHKVAEREERKQHKIIKISKIEDEQQHATEEQTNISDEFLNRVKERRHKLAMPADSDWESGAESQPAQAKQAGSESDADATPIRVLEGQSETNLRELPRHLREFAKFSTCEQMDGGQGQVERHEEQERRESATDNCRSSASKKSTIVKTYKVSRLPPSVQDDKTASSNHANTKNTNKNSNNNNNKTTTTTSTTSSHIEHESNSNLNSNSNFESNFNTSSFGQHRAMPATPSPSSSPFSGNFNRNFSELFASSPFRSKIFEEFDKYWRNFEHTTSDSF